MRVLKRYSNLGQHNPNVTKLVAIEVRGVKSKKQALQAVEYLYGEEATGIVPTFKRQVN